MEKDEIIGHEKTNPGSQEDSVGKAMELLMGYVPDDKKEEAYERAMLMMRQEYFEGPIPHPRIIREYENILSGSADRILKMAETQQAHRIELEKKSIESQLKYNKRGQIFGFVIFILGILLSVFFALADMKIFAGTFATITVVTIIALFIGGKRAIKKDLEKKSVRQQTPASNLKNAQINEL